MSKRIIDLWHSVQNLCLPSRISRAERRANVVDMAGEIDNVPYLSQKASGLQSVFEYVAELFVVLMFERLMST